MLIFDSHSATFKALQKPKQWGPAGAVRGAVKWNCDRLGLPAPLSLWPLWEGAGDGAVDLAGRNALAASTSVPTWTPNGREFVSGSSQYLIASSPAGITDRTHGSVFIDIDITAYTSFTDHAVWSQYTSFNPPYRYVGFRDSGSVHNVILRLGSDAEFDTGVNISQYGKPRIALTWDNGSYSLYIDGSLADSGAYTEGGSTDAPIILGARNTSSYHLDAIIKQAIQYAEVLSADEAALISARPYALLDKPSIPIWFDMGAGGAAATVHPHYYFRRRAA